MPAPPAASSARQPLSEEPPAYDGDVDLTVASPHDGGAPPAYCSFADQSASVLLASVAASRPSAKAPATDASYFFDGLPSAPTGASLAASLAAPTPPAPPDASVDLVEAMAATPRVRPPTSTLTPAAAAPRGAVAASRSVRFSRNPVDVSAGVSVSRQSVPGISMQSAEWVERTRGGADVMVRASAVSVESLALRASALAALDDDDEPPPTPFRDSYEPLRDSFAANVAPKRAGTPFAKPLGTPFRDSDAGPATPFARGATPFRDSFADDTPAASIDAPPPAAPGVDPSFLAQVQAMARAPTPRGVEARATGAPLRGSVESVRESGTTLGRPETAKSFLVRESGASLCRPDTAESVRVRESAASLCRPATARSPRESVEPARESAASLRMSSVEPARESTTSLRSARPATAKSVRQSVEPARESAASLRMSSRPATAAKSVRQSVEPARESTASLSRPATAKSLQIVEPARQSTASLRVSSASIRESIVSVRESQTVVEIDARPKTARSERRGVPAPILEVPGTADFDPMDFALPPSPAPPSERHPDFDPSDFAMPPSPVAPSEHDEFDPSDFAMPPSPAPPSTARSDFDPSDFAMPPSPAPPSERHPDFDPADFAMPLDEPADALLDEPADALLDEPAPPTPAPPSPAPPPSRSRPASAATPEAAEPARLDSAPAGASAPIVTPPPPPLSARPAGVTMLFCDAPSTRGSARVTPPREESPASADVVAPLPDAEDDLLQLKLAKLAAMEASYAGEYGTLASLQSMRLSRASGL